MLLLEDKRFYVYLDTRKPGAYEYGNYKFDFELFYVGQASQKRKDRQQKEKI